jgi:hypothetical protein
LFGKSSFKDADLFINANANANANDKYAFRIFKKTNSLAISKNGRVCVISTKFLTNLDFQKFVETL